MAQTLNIYEYISSLKAKITSLEQKKKEVNHKIIDYPKEKLGTAYDAAYVKLVEEAAQIHADLKKWNTLLMDTSERVKALVRYEEERNRAYKRFIDAAANDLRSYNEIQTDPLMANALKNMKDAESALQQNAMIQVDEDKIPAK
jgi:hypothetical protein